MTETAPETVVDETVVDTDTPVVIEDAVEPAPSEIPSDPEIEPVEPGDDSEPEERPIPRVHPLQVHLEDPWGDLPVQMRHYEDGTPAF